MKKNIKKIVSMFFAFAFLATAQTSFASVSWNTASNDCGGIRVANATTQVGVASCWTLSQVSANPSDGVYVRVYYHNTGDTTATNVRLYITQHTTGSATNHSFSGRIVSDQGSLELGTATVNLSSSQSLNFESTKWYANQTQTGQEMGASILSGGLNIGSITAGWSSQGTARVLFRVSGTQNQTCPAGYTGTPPNCVPIVSNIMSGNITASVAQCYIPAGKAVCPIRFVWTTSNPVGISAVSEDANGVVGNGNNSNDIFNVKHGARTYRLYNNSQQLDSETVSASCAPGSVWDGNICVNQTFTCPAGYTGTPPHCVLVYNNDFCEISNFTIDGSSSTNVSSGSPARLAWNTTDCAYVRISTLGDVNKNGSKYVYPYNNTNYVLTAYGSNGQIQTRQVYAYVNQNQNNCTISNFSANPTSITQGGSTYLSWDTNNCNSVSISSIGNVSVDGGQTIYPSSSTNYILTAYGNNGNDSRTIYVTVGNTVINNSCVVTNQATSISSTGVQLNGTLTGANSSNTYFEYGTTTSFGRQTTSRLTYGTNNFTETIWNLSPNTYYFYRLVSNCGSGQVFGQVQTFQTSSSTNIVTRIVRTFVPRTVVTQAPEVVQPTVSFVNTVGTISPIMLEITNKYEALKEGDVIDYTIKYKNIGNTVLTHALLQVTVPQGITLTNASNNGTYLNKDNTLSFQLNDIYPGQEGTLYAQGKVVSIVLGNNSKIVTKALLIYTTPNNTQENAIAYVTNVPADLFYNSGTLGAAAFFGWLFSIGFVGWLLLIILIIVLVLLARSYYRKTGLYTPVVYPTENKTNRYTDHI